MRLEYILRDLDDILALVKLDSCLMTRGDMDKFELLIEQLKQYAKETYDKRAGKLSNDIW